MRRSISVTIFILHVLISLLQAQELPDTTYVRADTVGLNLPEGYWRRDSVTITAYPSYDSVTNFHRFLFGKNYRKEWAASTKLPVIRISQIQGGLIPFKRGGGHQTSTLRLKDKGGKEWVLRSIKKYPTVLLPEALRESFANDWLEDNMSAQHPYSALIVPPIAEAAMIPHTNPIIGVVAPEKELAEFQDFGNTLCLLEEREPIGNSDNTSKMLENLSEDNDHSVDREIFLRALIVDVVIGDWDRHVDQWRWAYEDKGNGKLYTAVPRDRDQVFYVNEGVFPKIVSKPWYYPFLEGFDERVRNISTYLWESRVLMSRILNGVNYETWMKVTNEVKNALTDSVLEEGLSRLPTSSLRIRHDELLKTLKARRDRLPEEMEKLFRFQNKIADIQATDKNDLIVIREELNETVAIDIRKISDKGNIQQTTFSNTYTPTITKEIRLFVAKGDDSIKINGLNSHIKIRIVGGAGEKVYSANNSTSRIIVYNRKQDVKFIESGNFKKHLSNDTLNTAIIPTNRYNVTMPLFDIGYNVDDGFLLGLGIKRTQQGFRKIPFASLQRLSVGHSFSTGAFRIRYNGEWLQALGNSDIILRGIANAPDNTMNFFGRGNETIYLKTGQHKRYYRTRFNWYQLDGAVRRRFNNNMNVSVGPSFEYYSLNTNDNLGRFITNISGINSYDSLTINKEKIHGGLVLNVNSDQRGNSMLPSSGVYFNFKIKAYKGLNKYSKSYAQIIPEMSFYKSLTRDSAIVIANRIGGGITIGKSAFYQSMFLGGQENLQGFKQFRFAGQHMVYNNLEMRIRVAYLANYILPGEFGISGFYDTGRVWEKGFNSSKFHHGYGGGIYFSPARFALIRFTMGYSEEGWYPYVSMGFRF